MTDAEVRIRGQSGRILKVVTLTQARYPLFGVGWSLSLSLSFFIPEGPSRSRFPALLADVDPAFRGGESRLGGRIRGGEEEEQQAVRDGTEMAFDENMM